MNVYRHLMSIERSEAIGWVESFYWVLTTMSTLGYGDITFAEDDGRLFSMIVMFTGVFYLFIVLPLCVHGIPIQAIYGISDRSSRSAQIREH